MTDHLPAHIADDGPAALHATLRARGYRLTPQRQLVLDAVTRLDHGTPDEISTEVQRTATGVNLSTVYRTLELLEQLGMVTHTHLGHGAPTYHPASTQDHLHLVCRDCGRTVEVEGPAVERWAQGVAAEHGFVDVSHTVEVFGTCAGCAAQNT